MKWKLEGRNQALAEGFVQEVCRVYQVAPEDEYLRQAAWQGFCQACRSYGGVNRHYDFWDYAFLCTREALLDCRREERWWKWILSLDHPVSPEDETPRRERWLPVQGDFTRGLDFLDYLDRMEEEVRMLARGLMAGYSWQEVAWWNDWSPYQLSRFRWDLTRAMIAYQEL